MGSWDMNDVWKQMVANVKGMASNVWSCEANTSKHGTHVQLKTTMALSPISLDSVGRLIFSRFAKKKVEEKIVVVEPTKQYS